MTIPFPIKAEQVLRLASRRKQGFAATPKRRGILGLVRCRLRRGLGWNLVLSKEIYRVAKLVFFS